MSQIYIPKSSDQNEDQVSSKMAAMKISNKPNDPVKREPLANIGNRQGFSLNANAPSFRKQDGKIAPRVKLEIPPYNDKNKLRSASDSTAPDAKIIPKVKVEEPLYADQNQLRPVASDSMVTSTRIFPVPSFTVKKSALEKLLVGPKKSTAGTQSRFLALQKVGKQENRGIKYFEAKSGHSFEDIQDADMNEKGDCAKLTEYVHDIFAYLMNLENSFMIRPDFLAIHTEVNPGMRRILIEWINEVHADLNMATETLFHAISIIDLYTQKFVNLPRKKYQLVGTAALFIASKYEEVYPRRVNEFAFMTDNAYTCKQIIEMEAQILLALDFRLNNPTIPHFIRRYARVSKINTKKYLACKFLLELATMNYKLTSVKPSLVAAAALYIVLYVFNESKNNSVWTPTLEFYTTYKRDQLKWTVKQLANAAITAVTNSDSVHVIVDKYSKALYDKIATHNAWFGLKIIELAQSA